MRDRPKLNALSLPMDVDLGRLIAAWQSGTPLVRSIPWQPTRPVAPHRSGNVSNGCYSFSPFMPIRLGRTGVGAKVIPRSHHASKAGKRLCCANREVTCSCQCASVVDRPSQNASLDMWSDIRTLLTARPPFDESGGSPFDLLLRPFVVLWSVALPPNSVGSTTALRVADDKNSEGLKTSFQRA